MKSILDTMTRGALWLTIATMASSCASLYIKSGKEAYNNLQYQDAIYSLEKGLVKKDDPAARRMLAESYLMVNDYQKANEEYAKTALYTDNSDRDRILQGQALMANGKYPEARAIFEGIISRDPDNRIAQSMLQSCRKLEEMKRDSLMYQVSLENIPSTAPVYSAYPYNNGLIVSSPAAKGDADPYTNRAFTDLYFTKKEGATWTNPEPLAGINGKYHDAVATIAPNGQTMVFTRSFVLNGGALAGNESNVSNTQLYMSRRSPEGKWEAPELLPFCSQKYMFAHPTFSPDGKVLYFASDMPTSLGGMDIFQATYTDGAWGLPVNMGSDINTKANELFPVIRDENTLYFASEGHNTLGGLDIMYAERVNGTWGIPRHMSYPVNSSADDFSIVWNEDGKTGYFTSDRNGSDRIYSFSQVTPIIQFEGLVLGKESGLPLGGVRVTIVNTTDGTEQVVFTDGDGKFSAELAPGKDYKIKSELDGYFATIDDVSTQGVITDKRITRVVEMPELYVTKEPTDNGGDTVEGPGDDKGGNKQGAGSKGQYPVPNIYWDYNKWDIRTDAIPYLDDLVKLFRNNQNLKFEIQSHCDCRGSYEYNDDLSSKRAKAVVDYLVTKGVPRSIIVSKGYGERQLVNGCSDGVECDESRHQENRRTEFIVTDKK